MNKSICLIPDNFLLNNLVLAVFNGGLLDVNDGVILHQWSPIKEVKWAVEKCTIGCHFMVRVSSSCEGVKDVQSGVVRKGTQGVYC